MSVAVAIVTYARDAAADRRLLKSMLIEEMFGGVSWIMAEYVLVSTCWLKYSSEYAPAQ